MNNFQKHGNKPMRLTPEYIKSDINPRDFYINALPEAKFKHSYGWQDGGLCPFHSDNTTGSFRVNLTTGAFMCFACEAKGHDIIAFTMAINGIGFRDALDTLSSDWGVA